jgi:hypothetical protein
MNNNVKIHPQNSSIYSSFQYFQLAFITIDLLSLLSVAPMLHTFETPGLKFGRIHPRLLYLQR